MADVTIYRKCIEALRDVYNAYGEAVSVSVGADQYDNIEITFTIIKNNKGDKE